MVTRPQDTYTSRYKQPDSCGNGVNRGGTPRLDSAEGHFYERQMTRRAKLTAAAASPA